LKGLGQIARMLLGSTLLAPGLPVAVGLLAAQPSGAQTLRPALTDEGPLPPLRTRTHLPQRRTDPAETLPPPQASRATRPPVEAEENAGGDPAGVQSGAGAGDPAADMPPTGLAAPVRDGEPETVDPVTQPVDGAPEQGPEPYRNPDGVDPGRWDARTPDERATFQQPPAGFDPQLYQAEISPLDDRRTGRLLSLGPWEPRGVRVGSFVAFPTVDLGAAWISNLFRTAPARADRALDLRPDLRLASDWSTHALELRATGGLSFLDDNPSQDDRVWRMEARGRLDVTRRTSITGLVQHDVSQTSHGSLETLRFGAARSDVITDVAALTFDHRFNRLSLQFRGTMQNRIYDDVRSPTGVVTSFRDLDLRASEQTARATWTFKPTLAAFAEAAINQRRFDAPSPADGIRRDSDGERFRLGVGFGNTGQILRGETSIGYGRQRPLDQRLQEVDGLIVDANLAWRVSALTALMLRAGTDFTEISAPGSPGGLTRRASLELRHAITRPLIATAGLGHSATDYQGSPLSEQLTDFGLGLEYYLAPEAVLFSRWQHSWFRTTALGASDWQLDEVRIGVRLRR
jgi:hypothetical protein